MNAQPLSRRSFLKTVAIAGAALQARPLFGQPAPSGRKLKIGLVGCGGRGRGALANALEAAPLAGVELEIFALADVFSDNTTVVGEKFGVPPERRFVGFDAYRQVLEQPIDLVFLATPPNFRPVHFEAAIAAGKHCFIEKPVAVDPPGARRILAAGESARTKGLSVVAGAQRHYMANYLRNAHAVHAGAIGRITGGTVMWNQPQLWFKERREGESDAHYLARNWVNFLEMSGDHIVEQHFHNLDVANWFIGDTPVAAIGFGGRVRRKTGNQYDFFSVDFDYGQGCHIHSSCRQINGCYNRVGESFIGTEGTVHADGKLETFAKTPVEFQEFTTHPNGMVQEHVELLRSIVAERPLNDTRHVADSTLTAIMGRISAYTGQMVRWSDLTNPGAAYYDLRLSPSAEQFEQGEVVAPAENVVPMPGSEERQPA
ncbi:Gfo/Idh/MocA family protein [Opitutus terrae]|uniref:Oxidoreductase domain protein n=1 Tax=Opitutus terrae (strain DSM 11246 / JCM 15787 / PB90-1) TaxID=452637 RepID=B1ZY61_OPITP|nr:Gfo/Idh/MocA family oxidoreductase [Opitutus terrae]ACB76256.1 oxidoreductase domain protein [Opitutus terrae PB90-1]